MSLTDSQITFKTEYGAIIGGDGRLLAFIPGDSSSVEFPWDLVWSLHQHTPGNFFPVHTHPIGMLAPSVADIQMLKAWALAMHPYPSRLDIISPIHSEFTFTDPLININKYICMVESKEMWKRHGGKREFTIFKEEDLLLPWDVAVKHPVLERLLEQSYTIPGDDYGN